MLVFIIDFTDKRPIIAVILDAFPSRRGIIMGHPRKEQRQLGREGRSDSDSRWTSTVS